MIFPLAFKGTKKKKKRTNAISRQTMKNSSIQEIQS